MSWTNGSLWRPRLAARSWNRAVWLGLSPPDPFASAMNMGTAERIGPRPSLKPSIQAHTIEASLQLCSRSELWPVGLAPKHRPASGSGKQPECSTQLSHEQGPPPPPREEAQTRGRLPAHPPPGAPPARP
jgi:hypothetical protein